MEVHYKLSEGYLVALRAVHMEAVTTESPALGQEVGKQLARLPEDTATLLLRHTTAKEVGFTWSSSLSYIGSYVGNYEDAKRAYLTYPGYGLLNLSGGYNWRFGDRQFYIGVALRNALDRDLLATNARVGADRTLSISMRTIF